MLYFDTKSLVRGMGLARDIHFYDPALNRMVELKKNIRLTDLDIQAFKSCGIKGAFIEYIPDDFEAISTIDEKTKAEALLKIEDLAESFAKSPEGIQANQVAALSESASNLVTEISNDANVLLNISRLKKYDDYTFHHSLSVAVIALAIGMEMGFDSKSLQDLVLSGMLHDLGKVSIPIEIINKPARLTDEEFEIVKSHPYNAGIHLLKKNLVTENTFLAIISHHEKWDGSGYPNGIVGSKIPIFARILTVADVYDALTSQRPYRNPSQPSDAIEYIMGGAGTLFDIDVVKAFLRKFEPYPIGTKVLLSNGEIATVVQNHAAQLLRPVVKLNGRAEFYDLYNDSSKHSIIISKIIA